MTSNLEYAKNRSHRKGNDYELALSMFLLKRVVETNSSFKLATERTVDHKFDDMYLQIGDVDKLLYVQAKHRDVATKLITYGDLLSRSETDFSLLKYFKSYKMIKIREDTTIWNRVRFLICTTINLDIKGLNAKGVKVSHITEADGIFANEECRIGDRYELKIIDKKITMDLVKDAFSNLRKTCRTLSEFFLERKKINLDELPILRSCHIALVKEVIDNSEDKSIKFREAFIMGSNELSPEARKFRKVLYESSRELLNEMDEKMDTMYPKDRKKYKEILEKYDEIRNSDISDDDSEKKFWEKMKSITLPVMGYFGKLHFKDKRKCKAFIEELATKITEEPEEGRLITLSNDFGKLFFKLFGYVLTSQGHIITFTEDFLKREDMPESFLNFRNQLKNSLGDELFSRLHRHKLNVFFNEKDECKVYNEGVYWDLKGDFMEEQDAKDEVEEFLNKLTFVVTPKEDLLGELIRKEMITEFGQSTGNDIFNALYVRMKEWSNELIEGEKGKYLSRENNPYRELISTYSKPIWFNVGTPLSSFMGREEELNEIHRVLKTGEGAALISQNMLVSGMGGVGKSELARRYAFLYKEYYEGNVMWIQAESTVISNCFKSLADRLHVNTVQQNGNKRLIGDIVSDIYNCFARKKSLFIFDNAEEYSDIKSFLPNNIDHNPSILITSCNRDFFKELENNKVKKLDLDLLPEDQAMELVKITLENKENVRDDEIKALVKMLGCLPLALQHASAYINQSGIEVGQYIQVFRESDEEMKLFLGRNLLQRYDRSIYLTFTMALEKIRCKYGKPNVAIEILCVLGYTSPENIHKSMLLPLAVCAIEGEDSPLKVSRAKMLLSWSVAILRQYSLIEEDTENESLSIHRLVQHVIRVSLREMDEKLNAMDAVADREYLGEVGTLKIGMELIYQYQKEDCDSKWRHFTHLWIHACRHDELIDEFYFIPLPKGRTPLHWLSKSGNHVEVQLILSRIKYKFYRSYLMRIADMKGKKFSAVINAQDVKGATSLHLAVLHNRLDVVKALFRKTVRINAKGFLGITPLYIAAEQGSVEIVKFLVEVAKADISICDDEGYTPLDRAAYFGHEEVIEILTKDLDYLTKAKYVFIAKLNSERGCSLSDLEEMFKEMGKNTIMELVNCEVNQDIPINIAARRGYIEVAEYLIKKGAILKRTGFTQLHRASQKGDLEMVKLLLRNGADPKDGCKEGRSSLHEAASWGHLDVTRYFIEELEGEQKIGINVLDKTCKTPLYYAAREGKLHVVKYLLEKGAFISPIIYIKDGWYSHSDVISRLKHFLKDVQSIYEPDGDTNNGTEKYMAIFEKLGLTAMVIATALDKLETVMEIVENKTTGKEVLMEDIRISMLTAQLYRRHKIHKYLLDEFASLNEK